MDEKKRAQEFNKDLDNLLTGKPPAGQESSAEYQQTLATALRLIGTDFSAGFERDETTNEKIRSMAQKELPRQESRKAVFQRVARAANLATGAALLVGLALGLSLLFNFFLPGPGSSPNARSTRTPTALFANTEGKITVEEAGSKIREWFLIENPDLNPETELPLEERTTPEIWNRLGVQVFQVSGGNYQYETFLIHDGEVQQLGTGFGGSGVNSLAVSDLDRNGIAELVFSYSFGSGIHQSRIGLYAPENNTVYDAGIRFTNGDLELEKVDDVTVQVFASVMGGEKELIGTVNYRIEEGEERLTLTREPNLPPEVLENLSDDKPYDSTSSPTPTGTPKPTPTATVTLTPSPTATPMPLSALDMALEPGDLGKAWVLDAEVTDLNATYFLDRGEGGKAIIGTENKGYAFGYDPALVESISMRGFSQPEEQWVLFQVVVVFEETARAEEEFKNNYLPDCDLPCEHVTEYDDGSGDRSTHRDAMIGDESIVLSAWGLPDEKSPFFTGLAFWKGRVLVFLFSPGVGQQAFASPFVDEAQLEELGRIVEIRIP